MRWREAYCLEFAGQSKARRYSPLFTLIVDQLRTLRSAKRYRAWLQQYSASI